MDKQMSS